MSSPRPGGHQRRLGQNFVADPNLLELIVREAHLDAGDVALEIGGGGGALSERLAPRVAHLHVIELDQGLRPALEPLAADAGNVSLHWGDVLRLPLSTLDPAPTRVVANLPYSVATPALIRTIEELERVEGWLVMVQREIAERLRGRPGSKLYGAPSVVVQLACEVELVRKVSREVFTPRPRVDSALVRLRRMGPAAPPALRDLVREAFAHRRKALAGSLELAGDREGEGAREAARRALAELGLAEDARAEALAPEDFRRLAEKLAAGR